MTYHFLVGRPLRWIPLFVGALCALVAAQLAWHDPRYLLPLALMALLLSVPAFLARRRMRRVLLGGDPRAVLGAWERAIRRAMFPETMVPLMAATAYAAYGWVEAARSSLARAVRGPAWEAALEQRLFVETLLDAFEGERGVALEKAAALERMPIPPGGPLLQRRVARLRQGVGALARAFAHQAGADDERALERAGTSSPLVHWAMRYARAIIAVDRGRSAEVAALLADAPAWPRESAFHAYHEELLSRAAAGAPF